jgi:hypothetical protein
MPHPSTPRALTPAQRDITNTLTRLGAGEPVSISTSKLATEAGLTLKQVDQAINGLIASNALTKTWNPDRYVWTFTINTPAGA